MEEAYVTAHRKTSNITNILETSSRCKKCFNRSSQPVKTKNKKYFPAGIRTPEGRVKADNDNRYITGNTHSVCDFRKLLVYN